MLNEKIISLSEKIYSKRIKIIDEVNKNLKELYNNLDFNMENVFINYSSNISDKSLLNKEKFMKIPCSTVDIKYMAFIVIK